MDWHASVYGSRSGGGQYRDFSDGDADDDGVTYGARGSYVPVADDPAWLSYTSGAADDLLLLVVVGSPFSLNQTNKPEQ